MASRQVVGEAVSYGRLDIQDNQDDDDDDDDDSDPTSSSSRSTINPALQEYVATGAPVRRRQRPEPEPTRHAITAMSLVGLKNLITNSFFKKTVTPVAVRKSPRESPVFQGPTWSNDSDQPLLPNNTSTRTQTPNSRFSEGYDADVESQNSNTGGARPGWGFRVDANVIRDATLGLSDGLTVPFALTAGLSALGNTRVVIYGGFAELIAGAISMGLGAYLGAQSEFASYKASRDEAERKIANDPQGILADIADVFEPYVPKHTVDEITRNLADSPKLVDFVMKFKNCAEEPPSNRPLISLLTVATAYFLGGLLPLIPYFFVGPNAVYEGLYISIAVMVVALFIFGYGKTCVLSGWNGGENIRKGCREGVVMVAIGSVAAGSAMGLVRLFDGAQGHINDV